MTSLGKHETVFLTTGYHINRPPPSASTYSIPRRTLYILKRATAKFPGDLAVWLAYVEYAAREGMTKVVAKGLNSALQHHPLSPTLYLLLSYHHLHPGAPLPRSDTIASAGPDDDKNEQHSGFALEGTGPARTTLLLGLRLLPQSHELWREYIKLELGWVEALRRRWAVLGIAPKEGDHQFDGDAAALAGGDGAFGPDGEEARRAILSGQLVLHALQSSLKQVAPESKDKTDAGVLTGMDFRDSLLTLLRCYPSPLRTKAIAAVYTDLETVASQGDEIGARARLILITRPLYDRAYEAGVTDDGRIALTGASLVDTMGTVGRTIRSTAKSAGPEFVRIAGTWLAERIDEMATYPELQRFLFGTLKTLVKPSLKPSASLLSRHLALTKQFDPQSYLETSRAHATQHPSDPALQLARIGAEMASDGDSSIVRKACAEAARQVTVSGLSPEQQEDVVSLWQKWAQYESANGGDWKPLLRDSLRLGASIPALHATMLSGYYAFLLQSGASPKDALEAITRTYSPSASFFVPAFEELTARDGSKSDLALLYTKWRAACKTPTERVDAVIKWTTWLLEEGAGRDAATAKDIVQREVQGTEEEARLETAWIQLLDGTGDDEDDEMESGSEDEEEDDSNDEDDDNEVSMSEDAEGAESEASGDLEFAM